MLNERTDEATEGESNGLSGFNAISSYSRSRGSSEDVKFKSRGREGGDKRQTHRGAHIK